MKKYSVCMALCLTVVGSTVGHAQDIFRPTPQQAASIAYICKGWRPIAKDVFALKEAGQPKPKPISPLHAKIIDDIYYAKSSITTESMAEEVGEQLCVPVIK